MNRLRPRPIAFFLLIAFGLAYGLGFGYFAAGGRLNSSAFLLVGVLFMFTPAIATLATQAVFRCGSWVELGLALPRWRILLVAWLLPVLLVVAALTLSVLEPGVTLELGLHGLYGQLAGKLPAERLTELRQRLDHSLLARPGVWPALISPVCGRDDQCRCGLWRGTWLARRLFVERIGPARILAFIIRHRSSVGLVALAAHRARL
jgi:hypothetical protein